MGAQAAFLKECTAHLTRNGTGQRNEKAALYCSSLPSDLSHDQCSDLKTRKSTDVAAGTREGWQNTDARGSRRRSKNPNCTNTEKRAVMQSAVCPYKEA